MTHTNGPSDRVRKVYGLLFVGALLFSTFNALAAGQLEYSGPNGPQTWGGLCNVGKSQTPIDIVTSEAVVDRSLCKLRFDYGSDTRATMTNNAEHLALEVEGATSFGRFYLDETYNLTSFHFHSPSEHQINSRSYDLELHLVHRTVTQSGTQLAVIGLLYNQGPDNSATNPFLEQILDALPTIQEPDAEIHMDEPLDFSPLLPLLIGSYARYYGSLTTPPCTENVTWTVILNENLKMSTEQFEAYKSVLQHPNNRPLQDLEGRTVTLF